MKSIRLLGATLLASTALMGAVQANAASESITTDPQYLDTQTPFEATLQLPDGGGENPTPPNPPVDPDQPGNEPNDPDGPFGIAYQPDVFKFGTVKLTEASQEVTATAANPASGTFHVGVKDKTRETDGWSLKASLAGDITTQPGVTIKLGNATGEVKVNRGDSNSANLVEAPQGAVKGVSNVEISSTASEVMSGEVGYQHNDVYDYDLGNVTLTIADGSKVQADTYSGTVNWSLEVVAQP